jgi:hypothetical protein
VGFEPTTPGLKAVRLTFQTVSGRPLRICNRLSWAPPVPPSLPTLLSALLSESRSIAAKRARDARD